ncbi:hypothetical protein, partial [Escherichia coli]|uniref:hypothetical protein n=1 Tax=Escherichia coli TaxID=562 RepID=UPI001BB26C04
TSLKTSIKTITYLSDIGCLEIQGASLITAPVIHPHIILLTTCPSGIKKFPVVMQMINDTIPPTRK